MSFVSQLLQRAAVLSGVAVAFSPVCHATGISATATYTSSSTTPGIYNYSVTLDNTGTTTIGTFWFSWVPGAGFLSATPTNVGSPAGWADRLTNSGAAIQWTTTTNDLLAGGTDSGFSFDSTESPSQLMLNYGGPGTGTGNPVTTSFVYITTPLGDPGFQLSATPAATAPTPEPGSFVLLITGLGLLGGAFWYGRRGQSVPGLG